MQLTRSRCRNCSTPPKKPSADRTPGGWTPSGARIGPPEVPRSGICTCSGPKNPASSWGFPDAKPPAGLARPGRQLWRDILREWELDARELAILKRAAKQADTNDALEKAIRRDGLMIEGASGQRRLNAAVSELRQGQLALARLLGEMALPAADGSAGATATSRKAQKAANARSGAWRGCAVQPSAGARLEARRVTPADCAWAVELRRRAR